MALEVVSPIFPEATASDVGSRVAAATEESGVPHVNLAEHDQTFKPQDIANNSDHPDVAASDDAARSAFVNEIGGSGVPDANLPDQDQSISSEDVNAGAGTTVGHVEQPEARDTDVVSKSASGTVGGGVHADQDHPIFPSDDGNAGAGTNKDCSPHVDQPDSTDAGVGSKAADATVGSGAPDVNLPDQDQPIFPLDDGNACAGNTEDRPHQPESTGVDVGSKTAAIEHGHDGRSKEVCGIRGGVKVKRTTHRSRQLGVSYDEDAEAEKSMEKIERELNRQEKKLKGDTKKAEALKQKEVQRKKAEASKNL